MNFFAFIPNNDATTPLGTSGQVILKDYKTKHGAIKAAERRLGVKEFVVYSYTNFYDNKTFSLIHNSTNHKTVKFY